MTIQHRVRVAATGVALAFGAGVARAQRPVPQPPVAPTVVPPVAVPPVAVPPLVAELAPPDSVRVLPFDALVQLVLAAHPVARQAQLGLEQARSDVLIARGAFDPTVTVNLDQKTFVGKRYYNYLTAEGKIPLPGIGSDIKLAYERNVGQRIAEDRYTPPGGIFKLGIGVPLGQRILTDERRTALAQARALVDVADAERRGTLNKLLLTAAKDYASWYEAYRRFEIAREGVALATFRLRALRARITRGEAAPIDSVEALLEVQRRTVTLYEANQAYYAAKLDISSYLWNAPESGPAEPVDLAPGTVPTTRGLDAEPVDSAQVPRWLRLAAERHPEILKAEGKVDQAAAGRAFAQQAAIPFAELSLNSLAPQTEFPALTQRSRIDRNYALGGTVKTPILFLKERGKLRQADQKLEVQRLDEMRVRRLVALDVRQAVNDLSTLVQVIELQQLALVQARQLLRGEQRRFESGESSLLYVNLRERYVLEAEQKLAELRAKYVGTRAALAVAVGEPGALPGGAR